MNNNSMTLELDPSTDTTGNAEQVANFIGASAWRISGDYLIVENPVLDYRVTDNETYSTKLDKIPNGATIILLEEEQNNHVELKAGDEVTEQELQEKAVAPKVTPERIKELLAHVQLHFTFGETPTKYVRADAWLDGSFHLATAMSKAVNPKNFSKELGIEYSTKDVLAIAENKLWELEGYSLYQKLRIKQHWQTEYEREQNNQAGIKVGIDHGVEN
ncbi:Gp49 family protein [Acinetobacter sp. ANC 4218]|uniref:Gp49 family protein n=1 Tax=Acinetobacter sp. ANC 4218 TaxID=1977880 RepID=UPI00117796C0|nr:Gp49 family protein [Acinetobacter sp. ANC 4218]